MKTNDILLEILLQKDNGDIDFFSYNAPFKVN